MDLQTRIEASLVIKQIEMDNAAKKKIEEITRLRLGVGPGFATSSSQRSETASALGKIGGGENIVTTMNALIGSVSGLAGVLTAMVQNSKIIQKVMSTIGTALGLLVDVILMPFLPVIMIAMISLFKGIMKLYHWWKEWWSSPGMKSIIEWMKGAAAGKTTTQQLIELQVALALDPNLQWLVDWIQMKTMELTYSLVGTLDKYLDWIWGLLFGKDDTPGIFELGYNLVMAVNPVNWVLALLKYMAGDSSALRTQLDIVANFAIGLGKWIVDLIMGPQKFEPYYAKTPYELGQKGVSPGTGWGGGGNYSAQEGGTIGRTGFALVHKGETVIPAGKGGITVNITGQFKSDEEMYRKFVDRLRQEQWRTNV